MSLSRTVAWLFVVFACACVALASWTVAYILEPQVGPPSWIAIALGALLFGSGRYVEV